MGVGPIERVGIVGLPTKLADVFSPSLVTGWLNVDLVVAPVGLFPVCLDHPREPVKIGFVGTVDHAVEMETSSVAPFEDGDHRDADTMSFEPFPIYLFVEEVREVTVVLSCSIWCNPYERRPHLDALFKCKGRSNGIHKSGLICKFTECFLIIFVGIVVGH